MTPDPDVPRELDYPRPANTVPDPLGPGMWPTLEEQREVFHYSEHHQPRTLSECQDAWREPMRYGDC